MSRAIKKACERYNNLFTFADPNFNHFGSLYKATGWEFVGETDLDYWYVNGGWIMHKKTLWNRARNLCLSEAEYAERFGYIKVWGLPKKKFVFKSRKVVVG